MNILHKKIVTDESMHPVAIQISYSDWLEIEKKLKQKRSIKLQNLSRFAGVITLTEDPLKFQAWMRNEWK